MLQIWGVAYTHDKKKTITVGPGMRKNYSGLFSGALLGFRKVFLKAPDFCPIFSGIFSGFVAREVARAEIFQPVIGVKLTVDTDALSWFPHVREVRINSKFCLMNYRQSYRLQRFV